MFDVLIALFLLLPQASSFLVPGLCGLCSGACSAAVATEAIIQILFKAPGFKFRPFVYNFLVNDDITVLDGSAMVTGLLLALSLPPSAPFWMPAVVGSFVAIAFGKQVFGGVGYNIFNPALIGRAFLLAAWPGKATAWTAPIEWSAWTQSIGINPDLLVS